MLLILIAIAVISPVIGCLMAWWHIGKLEEIIEIKDNMIQAWVVRWRDKNQELIKYQQPRDKNGRFVKKEKSTTYKSSGYITYSIPINSCNQIQPAIIPSNWNV